VKWVLLRWGAWKVLTEVLYHSLESHNRSYVSLQKTMWGIMWKRDRHLKFIHTNNCGLGNFPVTSNLRAKMLNKTNSLPSRRRRNTPDLIWNTSLPNSHAIKATYNSRFNLWPPCPDIELSYNNGKGKGKR
jgi:hypothetical protein